METTIEKLRKNSEWLMSTLKEHPKKADTWQITVNFSGYSSLMATISDLMKLCTLANLSEEPYLSPIIGNPNIDLANVMELALQLMPHAEAEFLDEMRNLVREEIIQEPLTFNYSTVKILSKPAS